MSTGEIEKFDVAEHLADDPVGQEELLNDAANSGDYRYLAHAIGIVARAAGMSKVANETGMKRQALYRSLSMNGNPTLETVTEVAKALGLRVKFERIPENA